MESTVSKAPAGVATEAPTRQGEVEQKTEREPNPVIQKFERSILCARKLHNRHCRKAVALYRSSRHPELDQAQADRNRSEAKKNLQWVLKYASLIQRLQLAQMAADLTDDLSCCPCSSDGTPLISVIKGKGDENILPAEEQAVCSAASRLELGKDLSPLDIR